MSVFLLVPIIILSVAGFCSTLVLILAVLASMKQERRKQQWERERGVAR